jgi:hypothetical protein
MSYILVTFGYNQFNLFNIKSSTPTLIDKIKEVSFQNIVQKCIERDKQLAKEIDNSALEEEKIQKQIATAEQDLQNEKEKYDLAVKQLEAKKKREELEQKKKEAEEKAGGQKAKKKEEKKKPEAKKGKNDPKKNQENEGVSDQAIVDLKDKIEKLNNNLNTTINNKNIYNDKKNKLQELISTYRKKFKNRMNIKIDLADAKGEKINIFDRGDIYANEYLIEKTVYELYSFNEVVVGEEKDPKKGKKDAKKDDKKKAEEKKENKDGKDKDKEKEKENKDEKEEKNIEYVLEPVKVDGYCFRTIQEDEELGDNDKGAKDKKKEKKK